MSRSPRGAGGICRVRRGFGEAGRTTRTAEAEMAGAEMEADGIGASELRRISDVFAAPSASATVISATRPLRIIMRSPIAVRLPAGCQQSVCRSTRRLLERFGRRRAGLARR